MKIVKYESEGMPTIVFDPESYLKICEGCLIELFGQSKVEAELILAKNEHFSPEYFPPADYNRMALLDHETPYDTAYRILLTQGGDGHFKELMTLDAYQKWEDEFTTRNSLNPEYIDYIDDEGS